MIDGRNPAKEYVNPFSGMEIDASFDVEAHQFEYTRERNILAQAARRLGMRIRTERLANGFRVWRSE